MPYIGLDIGTTGCKATVVEKSGETVQSVYYEYDLRFPAPGWVELKPDDVWNAVKKALRDAVAKSGKAIDAVAVASFGEAVALLDADGEPVCDSIFYTDIRGNDCLEELTSRVDPESLAYRTGMPINGMYTLPKLMWLQKNSPQVLDRVRKMLPYGSYVAYALCGEYAVDSSLASRTLLFNRHTLDWDGETLSAFDIRRDWLPAFVPAGKPVGRMLDSVARDLGVKGNPVIVSGVHDQVAAALGAGAIGPGSAVDGIGSAECITAVLPKDIDARSMFRNNFCIEPHAVPGQSLTLVFTNTAGAALKWYRDTFEQELRARCDARHKNTYAELNKLLSDQPSPLLFLPHLAGTGTPYMDSQATGMLCGLTLGTAKPDIYRAILEGMNFEMRYNMELLSGCGMRFDSLTAVGGGASPDVLQIKADILNKTIRTTNSAQSGTVGLAMLCGLATGQFSSFGEGVEKLVKITADIHPDSRHRARYDEKYGQYGKLYQANREIYGRK